MVTRCFKYLNFYWTLFIRCIILWPLKLSIIEQYFQLHCANFYIVKFQFHCEVIYVHNYSFVLNCFHDYHISHSAWAIRKSNKKRDVFKFLMAVESAVVLMEGVKRFYEEYISSRRGQFQERSSIGWAWLPQGCNI